ncbi:MAG: alpha-L-fucosidase [Isosphaeraceae bacterium]
MTKRLCFITMLAAASLIGLPAGAGEPIAETPAQRDARLAWWREARFGLFLHWGPVSLQGTEISWSRANSNPAHPNKGPIPVDVYDHLYKEFNPTRFDAQRWVAVAKAAGKKYVILTAKHCDGFCLWDSEASDYNIMRMPLRRDVCAELAAAVRKEGLRIGRYYPPMDWRDPDCRTERNATYVASMQEQLRELLSRYGRIDLLWFDTDANPAPWNQERTYRLVRSLQTEIIINYGISYFPNVSMGWDSSPRANQADKFGNFGYPFTNTISGNTPERFREALEIAHKRLLARKSGPRVLTVNSWNEWTEGSYIEPDTVHG